ncbi:hypothetical protein M513_11265 [Trichuris suis]|uniref:Uncharacterized protein n=1 Tax=Trichuris suis TaxID=68888 RepID=A0A085LSA5_9BILA|nr:hypothetical protein M513_11265 [Trichuris suis]
MAGSFYFPDGDVVRKIRSEGYAKACSDVGMTCRLLRNDVQVGTKVEKLPHPVEVAISERNRMAVTEELRALRGLTDKALALKLCTEIQACRRVEALSRFHRSNRMVQTLLGTDEMIGFEDYLKHPDVDETIEHYFMRSTVDERFASAADHSSSWSRAKTGPPIGELVGAPVGSPSEAAEDSLLGIGTKDNMAEARS